MKFVHRELVEVYRRNQAAARDEQSEIESEMTKLTQELAVKLEQGRDLCQWHSMAN